MSAASLQVSVVIATYNRGESVRRLLADLARQTVAPECFEVIVVDDGSATPVDEVLRGCVTPFALDVVVQPNRGPAAARHLGIERARADLVVLVDDDMRLPAGWLAAHCAAHEDGDCRVALGPIRPDAATPLPLFERFHIAMIERLISAVRSGRMALRGSHLYSGNVSLRRTDYFAVGGFDPAFRISEDAELGIRLEAAGALFVLAEGADARHASEHASLERWLRRSVCYGSADTRVSEKHPTLRDADPWRFLSQVHPLSRPWLLLSALVPRLTLPIAWLATRIALLLAALGCERPAVAGMTFVYGVQYFAGVRAHLGSRRATLAAYGRHLSGERYEALGFAARIAKLCADIAADHRALCRVDARYPAGGRPRHGRMAADAVQRIGFQMMIAYRIMRFLRGTRLALPAKILSRVIRHLYAAEIHWDAELAPGTVIVHGAGLVISHAARVGPSCILFQHVTLGESIHPQTRCIGAPTLASDVHVGPGATLLGPIMVGRGTKIMAGAVLLESVPMGSLVEAPVASVRTRSSTGGGDRSDAREGRGALRQHREVAVEATR